MRKARSQVRSSGEVRNFTELSIELFFNKFITLPGGLPSDYELDDDSNPSSDSMANADDEEEDNEWNAMGAALEKEFLDDDD